MPAVPRLAVLDLGGLGLGGLLVVMVLLHPHGMLPRLAQLILSQPVAKEGEAAQ